MRTYLHCGYRVARPVVVQMMGGDFAVGAPTATRIVLNRRPAVRWGDRHQPRLVPIETRWATDEESAAYYARRGGTPE